MLMTTSLRILKEIWSWAWFWNFFDFRPELNWLSFDFHLSNPYFFWKFWCMASWEKYRIMHRGTLGLRFSCWDFFPCDFSCRPRSTYLWERDMHRPRSLFPLLSFQLGFSGIPESDAKTSISYLGERYTLTPFWDPFLSFFSEKVPFFPRRPGDGPISRFSSYHGRLRATLPGGSI